MSNMPSNEAELAAFFDHTNLKATATRADIERLCDEAVRYGFHSVCLNPRWVPMAAERLHDHPVRVCTVVGFALGADSTKSKAQQTHTAILDGADEIDMVADLASILDADAEYYRNDLAAVLQECHAVRPHVCLKVIIESAALSAEQKQFACKLADEVGVDFVKTSTGLHPAGGATVEDIQLMAQHAPNCRIKAAGGIRTVDDALAMIGAGATRIGASASVEIVEQFKSRQST